MKSRSNMKELVEYIAKSIVTMPDAVVVDEVTESDGTVLKLQVAPEDRGRVIGKQGKVAQSMRALLRIAAIREGVRAQLQIV